MPQPYHGGCECKAVRYVVTGEPIVVYACHCTICQSQSGSAFGMAVRIRSEDFHLVSGKLKTFSRQSEIGQVFTNSFCPDCGTRIHHQPSFAVGHLSLKPGTLDDTSWVRPTHHVFTRSAQSWMVFPEDAEVFGGAPPDAAWLRGE